MIAAIILCGLGLIPKVDTIEINRFGPRPTQQVILWQWRSHSDFRGHRVAQWWLDEDADAIRTPTGWRVMSRGMTIDCRRVIFTETKHDPEIRDRGVMSERERIELFDKAELLR